MYYPGGRMCRVQQGGHEAERNKQLQHELAANDIE